MKQTYEEAITRVFADEGGYSNDAGDPGGPTNWGITIADARMYWKPDASATDVRNMPKSVAEDIYRKHYAAPLRYDELPSGVDYAVLDFGVNSGDSRAVRFLQKVVGVPMDGQMGPMTLKAVNAKDSKEVINQLYDARMAFLRSLGTWSLFGRGWTRRCTDGRKLALALVDKYPSKPRPTTAPIVGGAIAAGTAVSAASAPHQYVPWILAGSGVVALISYLIHRFHKSNVSVPVVV